MYNSNSITPITEEALTAILFEKKKKVTRKTEKMGNDLPDGPKATPQGNDEEEAELDAEDTMEAAAPYTKDSPMSKGSPMSVDGGDEEEGEKGDVKEATPARKALAKRFVKAGKNKAKKDKA